MSEVCRFRGAEQDAKDAVSRLHFAPVPLEQSLILQDPQTVGGQLALESGDAVAASTAAIEIPELRLGSCLVIAESDLRGVPVVVEGVLQQTVLVAGAGSREGLGDVQDGPVEGELQQY